jgi:polysaccharide chain length determinant protein (PEP-CTERM system associated)
MNSVKAIIRIYARSLWRRRWYGVAVAWLFCLVGWGFVMSLPNIYEAKTRIYVDTESMLRPLLRGIAIDSNILSQVDLMQRTLLSRPNLEKVSHMADLDLQAQTPSAAEDVITELRQRIALNGEGRNLFSITYTGPDRAKALKVVQSLLTVFVESNLGNSRQDMVSAQHFIDEQLKDYAQQLDADDKQIADFKAKNIGFLPGENSYAAKLDQARQALDKTNAELDEDQQKRVAVKAQLQAIPQFVDTITSGPEGFGAGPPLASGPPLGGADAALATFGPGPSAAARVADLERKIEVLRETYTDQFPDVVRLKRLLDQAKLDAKQEEEKTKAAAERAAKTGVPPVGPNSTRSTSPNPVYEQLQLQLASLDTTIASVEARRQREQLEITKWDRMAKSVPEVAAQLTKLTRNYDVIKRAYDELLNRRESAKIGGDLAEQTQTVQFRIVDPPEAPPNPVAPKRILLLSAVFVGGIVAGAAFALLLAQIDDSVMTVRQLRELVTIPILGAVSYVTQSSLPKRRASGVVSFALICFALVMVFAGVVSLETFKFLHA